MTNKKITDFDDGGAFQSGDAILIARGGDNYTINGAQVPNAALVANTVSRVGALEANVSGLASALQAEIDAIETGAGLAANGAYLANASTNYLVGATSLADADARLDAKLKDVETSIANVGSGSGSNGTVTSVAATGSQGVAVAGSPITSSGTLAISLTNTAVTPGNYTLASLTVDQQGRVTAISNGTGSSFDPSGLQTEIDAIETGAGLASNGAYVANGSGNYISAATSLKDADNRLDAAIKQLTATGGGSALTVSDEGSALTTTASSINFVGAGVTATASGNAVTVTVPGSTGSNGTVTSVAVSGGDFVVSGSPITSSGTIALALANSGVTPGTYTNANITIDAKGRVTSASNGSTGAGGTTNGSFAHRYWRFVCLDSTNSVNGQRYFAIAEVEMRTQQGGNDLCVGGTPISRSNWTGNPAANAFDDSLSTQYETGGDTTHQPSTQASVGNWIGYDFGSPIVINVLTLKNNSNLSNERIVSGMFQYSDDGTLYQDAWPVQGVDTTNNAITTSINPSYTAPTANTTTVAPRFIKVRPPTAAMFPTVLNGPNGGTDILVDDACYAMWRTDGGAASGTNRLAARVKPISGSSWSATMSFRQPFAGVVGNSLRVGLIARDSTNNKMATFVWSYVGSGNPGLSATLYPDYESTSSTTTTLMGSADLRNSDEVTIRMSYSNASSVNMTYQVSSNYGRTWYTLGQGSPVFTPDQIGICLITVGTLQAPRCAIDVFYYSDPDFP